MNNKESNFISAVIYVRNDERYIGEFLNKIISVLDGNFKHSEIICVNDASNDSSVEIIKKMGEYAKNITISVINMSYFHGREVAMTAGVNLAIGDYVFEFDNIFMDYNPELIMQVYNRSLEGYDVVSASNNKTKMTSSLFYKVFDYFTDYTYHMATESFRIISRRIINRVNSGNLEIPYRKAIYASSGLKSERIVYDAFETDKYLDKKDRKYKKRLAADSLIIFTEFGYRFSMSMTIAMMIISLLMLSYCIVIYTTSQPIEGWTTTILFLAIAFFGLFGVLTVIIKYLQFIVNMLLKRKKYNYDSIEKITK